MSVETYFVLEQLVGQTGQDTYTDGEFNSPFSFATASTTEAQRELHIMRPATFTNFFTHVRTNNNTADGGNLQMRRNTGNVNQVLTVDQDTGDFEDTTNTDTYADSDTLAWEYNQGNNSIINVTTTLIMRMAL